MESVRDEFTVAWALRFSSYKELDIESKLWVEKDGDRGCYFVTE